MAKERLSGRLELRTGAADLAEWRRAARLHGYTSTSDWIRSTLRKESVPASPALEPVPLELPQLSLEAGRKLRVESRLKGRYRKTVLENGIRIVTEELPGVAQCAIGVLIECGSRDESDDETGLAHLCEHLMFQGTSSRDALQIARQIDCAGGQVGAFTTRDYTCYHASVLGDYCYHALDLLGDIMLNFTAPEESVMRERQSIVSEIRERRDRPPALLDEMVKASAWSGQPLGRPIAGTEDAVSRYTREEVIYFIHRNYTPSRMILAASGNILHDDFVAQARDAFWRCLGTGHLPPSIPTQFRPGVEILTIPTAQTYFCVGIQAPRYAHSQRYGFHVLDRILGGGISSRLFRRLREEKGLVYQVDSSYQAYRDGGILTIEGSTAPDCMAEVLELVLETLAGLCNWDEPVDEEELTRAKMSLSAQHVIASEDAHTRMCRLATQELYFGRHLALEEVAAEIDRVDLPLMRRLMYDYLRPQLANLNVALAGPAAAEEEVQRWRAVIQRYRRQSLSGPVQSLAGGS